MLAIIGGSRLGQLAGLEVERRERTGTPYGDPSGPLVFGRLAGRDLVFLARHGSDHGIPPHRVNYRANVWAVSQVGAARAILAVAAVGGIRADLHPGDLVLPDQIIDYTWGRPSTYHEGPGSTVTHVDFSQPYDAELRRKALSAAQALSLPCAGSAVYAATQGPRLETAAEINRLERDGADVVGMTAMPEAVLARELGVPYAAINVVANYAAGRGQPPRAISLAEINAVLDGAMQRVLALIERMLADND
ncbi:MAG TPA: S-methyl-5'-thioinosine phosphorylase [Accumulibacter sp.]|uniref:S-methyl-5'-thioinosine phosphorylase n=1 Tax=Accumulibacter sp. TaxID=2053492 RepID=UPI0028786784|nr:S-methyl-5'-thioinosine phosphorylase [Accumulibacter sp.]MDS4054877.1 S-methyl-5'-thioinosine phosphorylase [Accumulibacter sp.]HMV05757.1 S-methyl-5'-thioinosine phosphorylase [Accumulibacter sp.]HMW63079.1 S-methyl-5'-thioinosine phosphorylase [Accumulibacter sp.]HMW79606.1 S-methyl-5'-thioinosine phosphorylase [Accumulibacter sp.]HNB68466.1 S-methyl-5'-thioinosine phosphorylase [Accumulibacter sp.]